MISASKSCYCKSGVPTLLHSARSPSPFPLTPLPLNARTKTPVSAFEIMHIINTGTAGWCASSEEEEEEEESLFKADAVNEEDPERDRATQV